MKLTVGVCDDCEEQIDLIKNYLVTFRDKSKTKIISSTSPARFFSELQNCKPNLVFLDIDMAEIDGIKLGKKIKETYNDAVIIYITAYEKYALEAFRVRAFHYLIKPVTVEKFSEVFKEALLLLKKGNDEDKYFKVKKKGEYINLNYNDIYYFEKIRHKVKIITKNGVISFYGTFKNLQQKLDMNYFVRCHQGYIVNISKIRAYRDQMLSLADGKRKIPVSRSNIKEVKEMMGKRLFS